MTWPNDLQTRFCQYTGIPLIRPHWKTTGATGTLGCHWNHTGWCLHPVVFQWRSSVNLHNWNTLEDHWSHRYTGMPLEPHWLMLAPSGVPVGSSVNLHNWNTLEDHWKATGRPLEAHWHFSSGIPVYTGVYVPGTLDCHWIATGRPLAQGKGWISASITNCGWKYLSIPRWSLGMDK